ncbi:MAG: hypothetical protein K0U98_06680 [Deltaproteobacteria bacterium]|nr:hypothetical protein [Deltaproteobacteria bacterium]
MKRTQSLGLILSICLIGAAFQVEGEIRRDPNGVNVNSQGVTSVFITFGGLVDQVPVEATWCGELIPATPDRGLKCDPNSVFGRLPIRFDQSRLSAGGGVFTDIMTIPASVSRRAHQAAQRGETSSFFYVRRFVSTSGGPDEFVFVTCRLAGGGARVPLALIDVALDFSLATTVLAVPVGTVPSTFRAELAYNGSGRLRGRWEVVQPGEDPPSSRDLLTEATLPPEERLLQRRYTLVERFDVFLPPTGKVIIQGPDPSRLPTELEGLYQILLRVEAADDKEADSNRSNAGAGVGIVHSGAVAGFPLPTLRYFVGSAREGGDFAAGGGELRLLQPLKEATVAAPVVFAWTVSPNTLIYRLEVETVEGSQELLSAVLQQGIASYAAPSWLAEKASGKALRWRVIALGPGGQKHSSSRWREFSFE